RILKQPGKVLKTNVRSKMNEKHLIYSHCGDRSYPGQALVEQAFGTLEISQEDGEWMKRALQRLFSLTIFLTAEITASIFVSVIPRINGQRDEALKTGARLRKIRWLVAECVSVKRMKMERNKVDRRSDVLARQ